MTHKNDCDDCYKNWNAVDMMCPSFHQIQNFSMEKQVSMILKLSMRY